MKYLIIIAFSLVGVSLLGAQKNIAGITITPSTEGKTILFLENTAREQVAKFTVTNNCLNNKTDQRLLAQNAEVSLYIHNADGTLDSIYHPNVNFIYNGVHRILVLERGNTGPSAVPFFNSMHQLEIKTNKVSWAIDTHKIELGDNTQNLEMVSQSYFDEGLFEKFQNITPINPLIKFAVYASKIQQAITEHYTTKKKK